MRNECNYPSCTYALHNNRGNRGIETSERMIDISAGIFFIFFSHAVLGGQFRFYLLAKRASCSGIPSHLYFTNLNFPIFTDSIFYVNFARGFYYYKFHASRSRISQIHNGQLTNKNTLNDRFNCQLDTM